MAEASSAKKNRLEIKKYANRRYYDLTRSCHLTLKDIRGLIRQGYDVSVREANSSTDITAQVLTQMVSEFDAARLDLLPVELFFELIRGNESAVRRFFQTSKGPGTAAALPARPSEADELLRALQSLSPSSDPSTQ